MVKSNPRFSGTVEMRKDLGDLHETVTIRLSFTDLRFFVECEYSDLSKGLQYHEFLDPYQAKNLWFGVIGKFYTEGWR